MGLPNTKNTIMYSPICNGLCSKALSPEKKRIGFCPNCPPKNGFCLIISPPPPYQKWCIVPLLKIYNYFG